MFQLVRIIRLYRPDWQLVEVHGSSSGYVSMVIPIGPVESARRGSVRRLDGYEDKQYSGAQANAARACLVPSSCGYIHNSPGSAGLAGGPGMAFATERARDARMVCYICEDRQRFNGGACCIACTDRRGSALAS